MSDVLFVVPVFKPDITKECNGTLLLATILKEKGIDVDIYRYYESKSEDDFCEFVETSAKNILAKGPKIVSFYCRGDCYLANIRVAERIRELNPDIPIVFGGPQADISAKETIRSIPWVDYCCSGEGETTVFPLFDGLLNNRDVTDVRGLTYRNRAGEVVSNPRPELIADLDSLPFVDYSFIPEETRKLVRENNQKLTVDVGRGCPYNCAYCSTSAFWQRKFRLKSSHQIVENMKYLQREFGAKKFLFDHDLFTANKNKVYEFCKILKDEGLNYSWSCSSRADTIDKDLIEEMVSAGMKAMYLGIETGSLRMQKLTHKNLNLQKAFDVIKILKEKRVLITTSFIYGFPEETEEDVEETLQYIYRMVDLKVFTVQLHLCTMFPGTEYYNTYKDQLVPADNFSNLVGDFGVPENMEFIEANKELFPFYYEYRSELRDKLSGLEKTFVQIINLHKKLSKLDPEKVSGKSLVDLFLEFKAVNKKFFDSWGDYDVKEVEEELVYNYLSTIYAGEELEKLKVIFGFYHDLVIAERNEDNHSGVKMYGIDIDSVVKGKRLSEIENIPSMVYINKVGKKVSYIIKPLAKM